MMMTTSLDYYKRVKLKRNRENDVLMTVKWFIASRRARDEIFSANSPGWSGLLLLIQVVSTEIVLPRKWIYLWNVVAKCTILTTILLQFC